MAMAISRRLDFAATRPGSRGSARRLHLGGLHDGFGSGNGTLGSGRSLHNSARSAGRSPGMDRMAGWASLSFHGHEVTLRQDRAARAVQRWWRRRQERTARPKTAGSKVFSRNKFMQLQKFRDTKKRLQAIACYVLFLIVFTTSSVFVFQEQDIFRIGNHIDEALFVEEFDQEDTHIFKIYADIVTLEEYYQWLRGPFFHALYGGTTFAGQGTSDYPGTLFGSNVLLGAARISQFRVKRQAACSNVPGFADRDSIVNCFEDVAAANEDASAFGSSERPFTADGASWVVDPVLNEASEVAPSRSWLFADFRTVFANVYPAPRFPVLLPRENGTEALKRVKWIQEHKYIDLHTRAVFVELTTYNANLDMFTYVRADAEFVSSGGVSVSHSFSTVRLYSWLESVSTSGKVLEVIVVVFYIYFTFKDLTGCCCGSSSKLRWRSNLQRRLQNINVMAYWTAWVFRAISMSVLPPVASVHVQSNQFYNFRMGVIWKNLAVAMLAMNIFLCWFRLISFLSYVPRFALVTGTLSKAATGVAGFGIVSVVVFYGFAAAHMVMFGSRLESYRNLTASLFTLLKSLLGEFNLTELHEVQWFFGPLFFLLFTALAVFVVLNVLIAIISDAYAAQTAELDASEEVRIYNHIVAYVNQLRQEYRAVRCCCWMIGTGKTLKRLGTVAVMKQRPWLQKGLTRLRSTSRQVIRFGTTGEVTHKYLPPATIAESVREFDETEDDVKLGLVAAPGQAAEGSTRSSHQAELPDTADRLPDSPVHAIVRPGVGPGVGDDSGDPSADAARAAVASSGSTRQAQAVPPSVAVVVGAGAGAGSRRSSARTSSTWDSAHSTDGDMSVGGTGITARAAAAARSASFSMGSSPARADQPSTLQLPNGVSDSPNNNAGAAGAAADAGAGACVVMGAGGV